MLTTPTRLVCALAVVLFSGSLVGQEELFVIEGAANADFFGRSLAAAGDVDGDGITDIIAGAPEDLIEGERRGSASVYSGATRELIHRFEGMQSGDRFGISVAGAGDVDADGTDDVIVGASPFGNPTVTTGRAVIFSGATGEVIHTLTSDSGSVVDRFGGVVGGLGDVNWDGHADVFVREVPGEAFVNVYSGDTGERLYQLDGESDEDDYAEGIAAISDLDGDGASELVVSDRAYLDFSPETMIRGRVLIHSGADGNLLGSVFGDILTFDFAHELSRAGDINGDGFEEFLIGTEEGTGPNSRVQVICGATFKELYRVESRFDDDELGAALAPAGDVDGDGCADFIAGAPGDTLFFVNGGAFYVFSGASGEEIYSVLGEGFSNGLGTAVAGIGDVDGDGLDDIVASNLFSVTAANQPGKVLGYGFESPFEDVLLDFDVEDDLVTPLVNGQAIDPDDEFGTLVRISSADSGHFGAAIFDSTPDGPNQFSTDPDLLVDQGNLLILQEFSQQTVAGIFDAPNDAGSGGTLRFELLVAAAPLAVDLVDICPGVSIQDGTVRLTDAVGATRTFLVPAGWTTDGEVDPVQAVRTLQLNTLMDQPGVSATATASEDAGFDLDATVLMEVEFSSSGALANVLIRTLDPPPPAPPEELLLTLLSPIPNSSDFGHGLDGAGDVNGDGVPDIIVSERVTPPSSPGQAHVFCGATGGVLFSVSGDSVQDNYGADARGSGDVNADGFADIIVGAFGAGYARVYGGPTGDLLYEFVGGQNQNFGADVDGVGDVNLDGHDDVVVGARLAGPIGEGEVYVYSGLDGSTLFTLSGDAQFQSFGISLTGAGDTNGDGHPDILVASEDFPLSGQIALISGEDGSTRFELFGENSEDAFGFQLSGGGDVNNDGFDDFLAPAFGFGVSGRLQVRSGLDGAVLYEHVGEAPGAKFPTRSAMMGDMNGDGHDDYFASGKLLDGLGGFGGFSYVRAYSGATGEPLFTRSYKTGEFTDNVAGVGDVNGDGRADVAVVISEFGFGGIDRVEVLGLKSGTGVVVSGRDGGAPITGASARGGPHQGVKKP